MVRYYYLITWSVDPTHTAVGSRSSVFFFLCGFSFLPIAVADLVICAAHPTHAAEIGVREIFTATCAGGTKLKGESYGVLACRKSIAAFDPGACQLAAPSLSLAYLVP